MNKIIIISSILFPSFIIGKDNELVVKNNKDLSIFKSKTSNHIIIMGRKTFESLNNKPLKNRINIVISKTLKNIDNVFIFPNIEEVLLFCKNFNKIIFVIGGFSIFQYFIERQLYHEIHLTLFYKNLKNEDNVVKFPKIDFNHFNIYVENINDDFTIYRLKDKYENIEEQQYLNLMKNVIFQGEKRSTRNAITYSIFSPNILKFDISNSFPLFTTKKVWLKGIFEELMWFLRGKTNIQSLKDKGVHIWNGNTTKTYLSSIHLDYDEGVTGPIYGYQWRNWNGDWKNNENNKGIDYEYNENKKGIDQIYNIIELIKNNPNSRRIVLSAWNVSQLSEMCLPPCHVLYQFYVSNGKLSCHMYQRSADIFLGLPFNIASTSLLVYLIAHFTNTSPKEIFISLGDVHLYEQHLDNALLQLKNIPYNLPK